MSTRRPTCLGDGVMGTKRLGSCFSVLHRTIRESRSCVVRKKNNVQWDYADVTGVGAAAGVATKCPCFPKPGRYHRLLSHGRCCSTAELPKLKAQRNLGKLRVKNADEGFNPGPASGAFSPPFPLSAESTSARCPTHVTRMLRTKIVHEYSEPRMDRVFRHHHSFWRCPAGKNLGFTALRISFRVSISQIIPASKKMYSWCLEV